MKQKSQRQGQVESKAVAACSPSIPSSYHQSPDHADDDDGDGDGGDACDACDDGDACDGCNGGDGGDCGHKNLPKHVPPIAITTRS